MTEVIEFSSGDFVHLRLGAKAVPLPRHTGDVEWYDGYGHDHGYMPGWVWLWALGFGVGVGVGVGVGLG